MTHSENALLRDAADAVNAIALLSKVYEDGSTPLMASLDGGRVIACIEALTARVSELARAHADALEKNARLSAAVAERDGHIRQMVEKAAANSLDGYRELGARCAAAELRTELAEAELAKLRQLTAQQAEDDGLWFSAATAPEAYLQQELRKLHAAVEETK